MPMTYRISGRAVRFTKRGDVKHNEVISLLKRALDEAQETHPDTARWDLIVDLRKSTELRTDMELRGVAMALAQQTPRVSGRVAVVVTDPLITKQIRKFGTMAQQVGAKARAFRTLKEAEAWLKGGRTGR